MKAQVTYCPVYRPCATHTIIIGYNVWAYIGHKLLGEVRGSHVFVDTLRDAKRTAHDMRKAII